MPFNKTFAKGFGRHQQLEEGAENPYCGGQVTSGVLKMGHDVVQTEQHKTVTSNFWSRRQSQQPYNTNTI